MKKYLFLSSLIVLFLSGCGASKYTTLPDLKLSQKEYTKAQESSELSFALARPSMKVNFNVSNTLANGLSPRVRYDMNEVYCNLTTELQKLLLSKGFTIAQVFPSYDSMTFTEKRNTSALLYPEIIINIEERSMMTHLNNMPQSAKGNISISAQVNITMIEPLSNEKIWLKTISLDSTSTLLNYNVVSHDKPVNNTSHMITQDIAQTAKIMDDFFVNIYSRILQEAQRHISVEEFKHLNSDIEKLKAIKRY